jgi:hypothetical protein
MILTFRPFPCLGGDARKGRHRTSGDSIMEWKSIRVGVSIFLKKSSISQMSQRFNLTKEKYEAIEIISDSLD